MKKIKLLFTLSAISATMLMAGGSVVPVDAKVVPIFEGYHLDKTYVQEDRKLMWQDMTYTDKEQGAYKRNQTTGKTGSFSYAKRYCSNLNYAGLYDWRLPTSSELMAVHNMKEEFHQKLNSKIIYNEREFRETGKVLFQDDLRGNFWSSTISSNGKSYVVYTTDALRYEKSESSKSYIRCVRDIK